MIPVGESPFKRSVKPIVSPKLTQLLVLLAAGCLTTMTGGIVSPVLPEIVQQLQIEPRWAGMLVSAHALTIAVFTPLLGILADRIGKVRVLVPGLFCYAVFGAAGGLMHSFVPLLATRALLGIASGGIAAASIGLLGNMYEGEARSRVLGYATSAMTTVSILVPLIGGWAGQTHWQAAFFLYGLGLPLAVIAALLLSEQSTQLASSISTHQTHSLLHILRQPRTIRLLVTQMFAAGVVSAVVIYTPLYLKAAIEATPQLNGTVLAIRAVGGAITSAVLASRTAKLLGVNKAIALGFLLMAATVGTIPLLDQLSWIVPTAILFGVGFGLAVPNIYDSLANQAPSELRSSVLAIGTGSNSLGQFLSPMLLGVIWNDFGLTAVFYAAAGSALAISISYLTRQPSTTRHKV